MKEKWLDLQLGNILKVKSGHDQKTVECENGKYQILGTGGEIGRTNTFLYDKPSVLIGRKGTINKPMYKDEPFWTVDTLFYTEIKDNFSPKYVYYLFNTINWLRYNEASGVPSLTSSTIEKIKVKVPDLETQRKIVHILDTINAEITLTKNLIQSEKKTFSGLLQIVSKIPNSDLRQLGDIAIIKKGAQLNKENLLAHGIPVINGGIEPSGYTNDSNAEANTITISEGGNSCGFVNFQTEPFWSGGHCYTIKPNKINKKLLYFILKNNERRIKRLRVGSGLPNIQKEDLKKIKINIPSSNEHEKIVTLLNTSEDKINVLNILLEKELLIYRYLLNHLISGDFDLTNIKLEKGKEQQ